MGRCLIYSEAYQRRANEKCFSEKTVRYIKSIQQYFEDV